MFLLSDRPATILTGGGSVSERSAVFLLSDRPATILTCGGSVSERSAVFHLSDRPSIQYSPMEALYQRGQLWTSYLRGQLAQGPIKGWNTALRRSTVFLSLVYVLFENGGCEGFCYEN